MAEELALDHMTTGAGNDIERATDLARKMVTAWGMSDKLGPLSFGKKEEQIFLGRELSQHKDYSEKTAEDIDSEIRSIVTGAYENAKKVVKANFDKLELLAEALLERETLDAAEIYETLGMEAPKHEKPDEEKDET